MIHKYFKLTIRITIIFPVYLRLHINGRFKIWKCNSKSCKPTKAPSFLFTLLLCFIFSKLNPPTQKVFQFLPTMASETVETHEAEQNSEVEKLESDLKQMAQKILEYRTTLPDELSSTLRSILDAHRPYLPLGTSLSRVFLLVALNLGILVWTKPMCSFWIILCPTRWIKLIWFYGFS